MILSPAFSMFSACLNSWNSIYILAESASISAYWDEFSPFTLSYDYMLLGNDI